MFEPTKEFQTAPQLLDRLEVTVRSCVGQFEFIENKLSFYNNKTSSNKWLVN